MARAEILQKIDGNLQTLQKHVGLSLALPRKYVLARFVPSHSLITMLNLRCIYYRRKRVFSAYVDDRPFSVELVSAVLRQGSFVDKMHEFAWTEPTYFDDAIDEVVLVHAIARYHA